MDNVKDLEIADQIFSAGENGLLKIKVGSLTSGNMMYLQGYVYRSTNPGPTTLLLAGIHGDEINGIEIIRRILDKKVLDSIISGTVIVLPLVNVFGFINSSRYVPDGKDVNRSFPGALNGSLASRIARTLTKYIFPKTDYIIDLHTASDLRYNYPQIRYSKDDVASKKLALAFDAPYTIASSHISKSLRKSAGTFGIPSLIFEGGESFRIDLNVVSLGLSGIFRCLYHLKQINSDYVINADYKNIHMSKTNWVRATYSGLFISNKSSGEYIEKGHVLGTINDPYGQKSKRIIAKFSGHIIGHNNAAVVNYGDALFHIGIEDGTP